MASMRCELIGHRGARGLKPENTLPAFEAALDLQVSALETDLHLTRDGIVVCVHDAKLRAPVYSWPTNLFPTTALHVSQLTLGELHKVSASGNPDPAEWPHQTGYITPVTYVFTAQRALDPYCIPTLDDLFAFTAAYAGELGERNGKSAAQREHAARIHFVLELKRVPFHPEAIGDSFDGSKHGLLERQLLESLRSAGMLPRVLVLAFDHRGLLLLRQLEPRLRTGALIRETAPVDLVAMTRAAEAEIYAPHYRFLDKRMVDAAKEAKIGVLPWTVNEVEHMERLLDWGVEGMITDYPDRLAALLQARRILY